jgi:ribosome-associated protein
MPQLTIAPDWLIPASDLTFHYARSSGPGGQNVNKVATKVELRFDLASTNALTLAQKLRLGRKHPAHLTRSGDFLVTSDRFRSRQRNETDVLERFAHMLRAVRHPPKPRVATRVTRSQKLQRLQQKRMRGYQKRMRGQRDFD